MAAGWTFRTRTWKRRGYTAIEGSACFGSQTGEFFLVIGSEHISLDVQSLRRFADRLLNHFSTILGEPSSGPSVVNIGELMDSLDEVPVNATWSFLPSRRQELLEGLEKLVGEGLAAAPASAGSGE